MPILVRPKKTRLSWNDFQVTNDSLIDGEAEAGYESAFHPARFAARNVRGVAHLPATYTIRVWPVCRVNTAANKTAELLAHEQVHYDVGIICAYALAQDLDGLNAPTPVELLEKVNELQELHMFTRAEAIQIAYDNQTKHSKDATKQKEWETAMAECLAKRTMTRIMGLPL